ncbi:Gfo/Idh/MocA family oxidoreductase [Streptomyces mirabilis]|uniref:Gfo/Idh/MocA family oxidoreductase n=1 Tax=Streptomyces mirabilis TaxID=68239 RepID=UPI003319A0EC
MRIGIMGLGRIGAFHAETLAGLDGVDSLVVTDPVAAAVATATERFGATATDSPEALLAAGVDGVVIAAATDAHPDLILAAVQAGIPVFCEKPVARGVEESREVLRAVEGSGVEVHIGYNRRFDAGCVAARRAVLSGELGDLHTVRSTTFDPAPPPPAYVAVSGGIFRDCGVHDLDIVRWVTGREMVEVYATGGNRGAEYIREAGHVDTASALLTLADRLPLRSVEPGTTFPAGTPHTFFMDRFAAAYRAELTAFTEVVAGTRTSPCTVADAIEASWIAEACTLSLHEHRPVRLDEVRK